MIKNVWEPCVGNSTAQRPLRAEFQHAMPSIHSFTFAVTFAFIVVCCIPIPLCAIAAL